MSELEPQDPQFETPPEAPPQPVAEEYPFWTWVDLLVLAALLFPILLMTTVGAVTVGHLLPALPRVKAAVPLIATFSAYGLWFLALYGVIKLRYDRPFWSSLAWTPPAQGYISVLISGLGLAAALLLLAAVLRPPQIKTPFEEMMRDPVSRTLVGFFAVTLGPVCEELIFRGFLMPLVSRSLGTVAGITIAAAPFALLHGSQYSWSWKVLLIIFLAGCAFGWMRHRTGSTAAASIMHCGYNLMQFTLGLLGQTLGHTR